MISKTGLGGWAAACGVTLALAVGGFGAPAQAAPGADPTLIVALYAKPSNRPTLRQALAGEQAARLKDWRRQGLLKSYRLLFTRYADTGAWDGLELLTFRDETALARWKDVERQAPGGLADAALRVVDQVVSTPADQVRRAGASPESADPVFLVVPYTPLVSAGDYMKYLDGYTLPQFEGWIGEGVLDGYEVETSRYPADRPWGTLILLRYRNDAALARRDEVKDRVRERLSKQPAWKAISDNKKQMREEKAAAQADQLAAEGTAP